MWWDGRMIKTKFVFAVSMVAMLSCGVAWASAPAGSEETVADVHDVYMEATNAGTSTATNLATGIAGVTYVNRMVNTAGDAAQRAENHAAAAGAYAIQAETAANTAKNALSGKLDNKFAANKKAIVTTDKDGKVVPGTILYSGSGPYIADVTVSDTGVVTLSRGSSDSGDVTDALGYTPEDEARKMIGIGEEETAEKLTDDQWKSDELYPSMNTATKMIDYKIATNNDDITGVISDVSNAKVSIDQTAQNANKAMITDAQGKVTTGQIKEGMIEAAAVTTTKIKDAAVTVAKTSGIFGYIPTSSSGTGSAQIWVE